MKKIGIITINDYNNYGNRLQNYAVQQYIMKYYNDVKTIKNIGYLNKSLSIKNKLHYLLSRIKTIIIKNERKMCFAKFNENIEETKKVFYLNGFNNLNEFDYLIVGSDQVWNPKIGRLTNFDLLSNIDCTNKISFSASFGISELPEQYKKKAKDALMQFKEISVREEAGKKIVEDLTGRKDVEVLVDPTMLLTAEEWDNVSNKPEQLKTDKYILNYFLGELSEKRKNEIDRIAKENGCKIINMLDSNSPFYKTGPAEFLYLEKNAFLICTDSFHACVFSILYNRPFIVFEREDNNVSMNSRIDTLLNKFHLQDRRYNNKILQEQLKCDYSNVYEILEEERKRTNEFLNKALNVEENKIERK